MASSSVRRLSQQTGLDVIDQENKSFELRRRSKDAGVQAITSEVSDDAHDHSLAPIPATIDSQVRIRRVFSFTQIFMFSLTYMAVWEGMCT